MCLGIPGQIISVTDVERKLGIVEIGGVRRTVNLACVMDKQAADDCLGAWVLVHVGFAMARIDEDEAKRTLALLDELGELQSEVDALTPNDRSQPVEAANV